MINFNLWIAFVGASLIIGLVPGPGVISIVGYAINSGRRTAMAAVAGMVVGNSIAMSLSLAGVGTLLAASAIAFSIIKWVGALYLIGLGVITILKSRADVQTESERVIIAPKTAFLNNVLVGTFHPKTIVFFIAFVPQFMDPTKNYWIQSGILLATFVITVGITDACYGLLAARASHMLRSQNGVYWTRMTGGAVMVAAGMLAARSRV